MGHLVSKAIISIKMKKYCYIFLISIIALSCNNSQHNDNATAQDFDTLTESKKDSIAMGYGGYLVIDDSVVLTSILSSECRRSMPLYNGKSFNPLGDIYRNDTLRLFAEFCQCGEFGGNRENILIYRVDTTFECLITKDSVACRSDGNGKKYFRVFSEKYPLYESSMFVVIDYLELLLRYSLMSIEKEVPVAGYFSATMLRGVDFRKDFSIDLYDAEVNWIYFDILKHELQNPHPTH